MTTSCRWFRNAVASKKNWLSINTNPEVSSPPTLQLHYFLYPGLAIKNYKKRNKNRKEPQVNILVSYWVLLYFLEIWNKDLEKYVSCCDCGDCCVFCWLRLDYWVRSYLTISSRGWEERKTERMKYRGDAATTSSPGQITT